MLIPCFSNLAYFILFKLNNYFWKAGPTHCSFLSLFLFFIIFVLFSNPAGFEKVQSQFPLLFMPVSYSTTLIAFVHLQNSRLEPPLINTPPKTPTHKASLYLSLLPHIFLCFSNIAYQNQVRNTYAVIKIVAA